MRRVGSNDPVVAPEAGDKQDAEIEAPSPAPHPPIPSSPGLPIPPRERALLQPQVAALAAGLADPALRERYVTLLEEMEGGEVSEGSVGVLENLLEMGLQTGRFRQQHGPTDAQALYRLYAKTPRGQAIAAALDGVNAGLAALDGQTIDRIALSAKGPNDYDLAIETDRCQMTVTIGMGGVRVTSVEMGI